MFKTLELPGGFAPLAPYQGFALDQSPGPTGGLKRPPDPSPNNFAPPFLIPGYGPGDIHMHKVGVIHELQEVNCVVKTVRNVLPKAI